MTPIRLVRSLDLRGLTPTDFARPELVALLMAVLAIVGIAAVATATGRLIEGAAIAAGLLFTMISVRWPLLPLLALVALIPLEEIIVIEGLGTLSRFAAILFIVAYGVPRLGRLTIGAMPLAGWAYVAWATLSLLWSIDVAETAFYLQVLALLFAVAVVVAAMVVERPGVVRPMLWAYSLSAAATAVIGILQYVIGGGAIGGNDRIAALEGQNPAYYAAILLPAMMFAAWEAFNGRAVLVGSAVALSCAIAIVASGTRGAWVSAIVVFVLYILPRLDVVKRATAGAAILVMALVVVQLPGISAFVEDRVGTAVETGGAGRTDIWTVGLGIWLAEPIQGVGYANFSTAFTPERARDSLTEIIPAGESGLEHQDPHNIILGTLAELGLVGLVLLGLLIVPLLLRRGWGPDAVAVQSAFASLMVLALFLDVFGRKQTWLLIGLAVGLAYLAERPTLRAAWRAVRLPRPTPAIGPLRRTPS